VTREKFGAAELMLDLGELASMAVTDGRYGDSYVGREQRRT
jgi:hypothetical protein